MMVFSMIESVSHQDCGLAGARYHAPVIARCAWFCHVLRRYRAA